MNKLLVGVLGGVLLCVFAVFLVMWSGTFPVAASQKEDMFDPILGWVSDRAIDHHARGISGDYEVPTEEDLTHGLEDYAQSCSICHGVPDSDAGVQFLVDGLNPPAPPMDSTDVQDHSDAALFWIIKNGIRATGMPSFGGAEPDDELWELVRVVRAMPHLDESQRDLLVEHVPQMEQEGTAEFEEDQPSGSPSGSYQESVRTSDAP